MISVILRYGALLALFLIAAETAKRSYITRMTDLELYMGVVGAAFLVLGIIIARRMTTSGSSNNENTDTQSLTVLDHADFSERELDVLVFMCHGYTNSEIADQLGISGNTVKTHLKNIYGKLGVSNRTQAAAEAKLLKIIG